MNLTDLGWGDFFRNAFEQIEEAGVCPARVAREDKGAYLVLGEFGELRARVSGRLHHETQSGSELPAVGDWVAVKARPEQGEATIFAVLPRRSCLARNASTGKAEKTEAQALAANVDTAFLVTGLDGNFNVRRIERYVTVAWESGASPVVVLNKADLCDDLDARVSEVESVAYGVPVHAMSATEKDGLDVLYRYLGKGKTVVLLGSSGVGKSTIINSLIGEERQKVKAISGVVGKGIHTTTSRELLLLPGGGILIDTPGMRELQLWCDEEAVSKTFDDIEELARLCRFGDCRHGSEPGCAVKAALEDGTLAPERLRSYFRLQRELKSLAHCQAHKSRLAEKKFGKLKKAVARRNQKH